MMKNLHDCILLNSIHFKVARNSFLARAAWSADCACSREHTRLTQFLSVLYHCAKFYKFSPSTFKDIFDRNINFAKFSRVTRSLNLHLREPGVLAQARAISGPGRARQDTISSHLKLFLLD